MRAEAGVNHPLLKAMQRADAATDMPVARAQVAEAFQRVDAAGGAAWPDDRTLDEWGGFAPDLAYVDSCSS